MHHHHQNLSVLQYFVRHAAEKSLGRGEARLRASFAERRGSLVA
jgi:hypothetical protein